jgi:Co/Zn/Cd efflux system component
LLVAKWSIGLLKTTSKVLLDYQAEPSVVDEAREALTKNEGDVLYDLHVWSIAPGKYSIIAGIASDTPLAPDDYCTKLDKHKFPHVTVEVQSPNA